LALATPDQLPEELGGPGRWSVARLVQPGRVTTTRWDPRAAALDLFRDLGIEGGLAQMLHFPCERQSNSSR